MCVSAVRISYALCTVRLYGPYGRIGLSHESLPFCILVPLGGAGPVGCVSFFPRF